MDVPKNHGGGGCGRLDRALAVAPAPRDPRKAIAAATSCPTYTLLAPASMPSVVEQDVIYEAAEWPSVVAPLLVRFRCYPRGDFVGFNGFQVQIMVPSSNVPSSSRISTSSSDSFPKGRSSSSGRLRAAGWPSA